MEAGHVEGAAAVVLADQLGRESEHAQRPPAEGVDQPQSERDRHEQGRAQPDPVEPPEPEPEGEGDQRQPHRQREIDEAEQEREIVGERHREQGGRRHPAMHFVGDPEQAADGQRRDGEYDELHRGFEPDQRRQPFDQQVDAEIADHRPLEAVKLAQIGRGREIELDPIAAHMAGQIEQGRHVGPDQGQGRQQDQREDEVPALPERPRRAVFPPPKMSLLHCPAIRFAMPSRVGRRIQPKVAAACPITACPRTS